MAHTDTESVAHLLADELSAILEEAQDADIQDQVRSELFTELHDDLVQIDWGAIDVDAVLRHPTFLSLMKGHIQSLIDDYTEKK